MSGRRLERLAQHISRYTKIICSRKSRISEKSPCSSKITSNYRSDEGFTLHRERETGVVFNERERRSRDKGGI